MGPPGGVGFVPRLTAGMMAGQLRRDQVLDPPDTVKAAIEQQELQADAQGDQTRQEGAHHGLHGLLDPHTTERQGIAAAPDHGRGGGRGEKVRRAPLGLAAADFVLRGRSHGAVGGQREPSDGDAASALAHALGDQPRQESIDMPCERIEGAEGLGPCAPHYGGRRGAFTLWAGLLDRERGGRGQDPDPQPVPTWHGAGHGQGQRVERVEGEGVHVLALQGILRIGRHRDSPMRLRAMDAPSRYRKAPFFLKPYMTVTPFSATEASIGNHVIILPREDQQWLSDRYGVGDQT